MCCSFLVQVVYGAVCAVATGMTIAAMVTPGWTTYDFGDVMDPLSQGILPFTCTLPGDTPKSGNGYFDWNDCAAWFDGLKWTEKMVVACMCIALAFEVISFVYNLFTLCACCCKRYLIHPLGVFTLFNVIFLAIAVITYAIDNPNYIDLTKPIDFTSDVGYSFWLSCGALALNVINMVVASTAACCAKGCC